MIFIYLIQNKDRVNLVKIHWKIENCESCVVGCSKKKKKVNHALWWGVYLWGLGKRFLQTNHERVRGLLENLELRWDVSLWIIVILIFNFTPNLRIWGRNYFVGFRGDETHLLDRWKRNVMTFVKNVWLIMFHVFKVEIIPRLIINRNNN